MGLSDAIETTLRDIAAGNVSSVKELSPGFVEDAAAMDLNPPLMITRDSLERVLVSFLDGDFTSSEVQQWASFVRRGYVAIPGGRPAHPIAIEYFDDDQVAEVISRLDELGDEVDGVISSAEIDSLLANLRKN